MQRAERDLRTAITKEMAKAPGATLSWGRSPRAGEAIIRLGQVERRVVYSREASRHDKASAIGRVRRALSEIGIKVETPPAEPEKPRRKRKPRTHERRIKALEATVAALVERIASLEGRATA